jgi:hypothetical protein
MSTFFSIVTTTGGAKLAAAVANENPLTLTHVAVGDGTNVVASATELTSEKYRGPVSHVGTVDGNPNLVMVEVSIPNNVGDWYIREAGVFDDDGDLIAIARVPDTYKPLPADGATREVVLRMFVESASISGIALTVDPSVMVSRAYVALAYKTQTNATLAAHAVEIDTKADDVQTTETFATKQDKEGPGSIPVGAVIATFPNMFGAYACSKKAFQGSDSRGFVLCSGTVEERTVPSGETIEEFEFVPEINNNVFLMGATGSYQMGGSNTKDLLHTHALSVSGSVAMPTHSHTLNNLGGAKIQIHCSGSTIVKFQEGNDGPSFTYNYFDKVYGSARDNSVYIPQTNSTPGLTGRTSDIYSTAPTISITSSGTSGTGSLSSSTDIRPAYISAVYVMRIK